MDAETGLMYYRHRVYLPPLGRFGSRDPVGYGSGDHNLQRYVENRPMNVRDPNGLGCMVDYLCTKIYELDDATLSRACYYLCKDVKRTTSGTGSFGCGDPPIKDIPIGGLTHIKIARRYKCFECKDQAPMRKPYDFTPGSNLFPSVDYEECIAKCSLANPVKVICGGLKGGFFSICEAMVGSGMETCRTYCEIFQK